MQMTNPLGVMTAEMDVQPSALDNDTRVDAQLAAEEGRKTLQALHELCRQAGASRGRCRLDNFHAVNAGQKKAIDAVRRWINVWRQGKPLGLVLYGPVGTGKDHLAFAATFALVAMEGVRAYWCNGREFAGQVRETYGDNARPMGSVLSPLIRAQLLVLSDPLPPVGDLTPSQADAFYRLAESRDANGLPTVVTINVADDREADARLGAATWDRFCHQATKIRCNWPSYRQPWEVVE